MIKFIVFLLLTISLLFTACTQNTNEDQLIRKGNVIFIHPDGAGLAGWNALRILEEGPDGQLNWDQLQDIGLYKSHTKSSLTTSSNAGATMHAYGKKVHYHSFGMDKTTELTARSGKNMSIMQEAMEAGMAAGIVNSGSIIEPGTAVFVASATSRKFDESITKKVVESGADVILSGGEEWMIPEGTEGKFGSGRRTDGLNLIDAARGNGYTVIYTREELLAVPAGTTKLLGVFAKGHTFNDKSEEVLAEKGLPNYSESAPTLAEMTDAAIKILSRNKQFFLVVEEEGSDNFANKNNANGTFEALSRANEAIGVAKEFSDNNGNTLVIVASDSEAGGLELVGNGGSEPNFDSPLPSNDANGAPIDGIAGTGTPPFVSKPDQFGNKWPFAVMWSTRSDAYGGVVVRSTGANSFLTRGLVGNTDIYRIMYATLFGDVLD